MQVSVPLTVTLGVPAAIVDGETVLVKLHRKPDCGEDSGAKYAEVLAFVAIATIDRSKSTVATQEETLTLSQPQQRTQPVQ
ncbi:MAG TPA: hypothetical protein VJZ32_11255 [Candidatus Bathyarchaeia archaeon]|nr:hypothetical protein [Candidatus Bathyarchaeia archaeon]